jgi:hypothetical protein
MAAPEPSSLAAVVMAAAFFATFRRRLRIDANIGDSGATGGTTAAPHVAGLP